MLYRVVSALGKVQVTRAYLTLENPKLGLVLTTIAHFYAIVKPPCTSIDYSSWAWEKILTLSFFSYVIHFHFVRYEHCGAL